MLSASINVRLVPLTDFAEFFIEAQRLHGMEVTAALAAPSHRERRRHVQEGKSVCALFQLGLRLIDEAVSGRLRRQPRHGIGLAGEEAQAGFHLIKVRADDPVARARQPEKVSLRSVSKVAPSSAFNISQRTPLLCEFAQDSQRHPKKDFKPLVDASISAQELWVGPSVVSTPSNL